MENDVAKPRHYLDTSVFYGVYNRPEFRLDSRMYLNKVLKGEIICLYSKTVRGELRGAPRKVRDFFDQIPKRHTEQVAVTLKVRELAKTYIKKGVVGRTSEKDCLHIAAAAVHGVDMLVSWNFKHIVNFDKIKGYNDINLKLGYSIVNICSPAEVLEYGRV